MPLININSACPRKESHQEKVRFEAQSEFKKMSTHLYSKFPTMISEFCYFN